MLGFSLAIEATRSRSPADSERVRRVRRLSMNRWSSALSVFGAGAAPDRLRVSPLGFRALRIWSADFSSAAWIDAMPANRATTTAARPTLILLNFRDIALSPVRERRCRMVRTLRCVSVPSLVSPEASRVHALFQRFRSFYSIIFELAGDVLVDRLGGGDVGISAGGIAVAQLGLAAAEQGRGVFRVDPERGVVVGDGTGRQPDLQVDETAAVEGVDEIRLEAQRFVAVPQRDLQIADDGARPAAIVERFGVLGVEPDRLVEILDRLAVAGLLRMRQATLEVRVGIVGILLDLAVEFLDQRLGGRHRLLRLHLRRGAGPGLRSRLLLLRRPRRRGRRIEPGELVARLVRIGPGLVLRQ